MTAVDPLLIEKRALRSLVRMRLAAMAASASDAGTRLAAHAGDLPLSGPTRISAFWPVGYEIDIRPLMRVLHEQGHSVLLPDVVAAGQPLSFRVWAPGMELVPGYFGQVPPELSPTLDPDLLLVPLTAFDGTGRRLGQGGGFYDRTLAKLRGSQAVTAVGIGYAAQKVDRVPTAEYDARLDAVLTEDGYTKFPESD